MYSPPVFGITRHVLGNLEKQRGWNVRDICAVAHSPERFRIRAPRSALRAPGGHVQRGEPSALDFVGREALPAEQREHDQQATPKERPGLQELDTPIGIASLIPKMVKNTINTPQTTYIEMF